MSKKEQESVQGDSTAGQLTIVGLGPGAWENLTLEAVETLGSAGDVYVRSAAHASIEGIKAKLPGVTFHSFDYLLEESSSFDDIEGTMVNRLVELAGRPGGLVYAVPGSPSIGERTVRLLSERLAPSAIRSVQGISVVEPVLAAAGARDPSWLEIIDATEVALLARENAVGEAPGAHGPLPWRAPVPTSALLISHLHHEHVVGGAVGDMVSSVKLWLGRYYPDEHPVTLVGTGGAQGGWTRTVRLHELDGQTVIEHGTALFVPPLIENENVRTFAGLMQLTRRLRAPGGCPWDREQTHASLKPHLLEEAYEVLDALDSGDPAAIMEELGDLLFQVTIHSQVAAEADEFTIEDVIESIMRKLIGRHPHVFGELQLENAQDVRHHWELFKQREKPKRTSILEEIPRGLPALPQSNLMQKRTTSVGFRWPTIDGVFAKVEEELAELRSGIGHEADKAEQQEELGDVLFALVSLARHLRLDPEEALRLANRKFATRFRHLEALVAARGHVVQDIPPAELDRLWQEAKTATSLTAHSAGE